MLNKVLDWEHSAHLYGFQDSSSILIAVEDDEEGSSVLGVYFKAVVHYLVELLHYHLCYVAYAYCDRFLLSYDICMGRPKYSVADVLTA